MNKILIHLSLLVGVAQASYLTNLAHTIEVAEQREFYLPLDLEGQLKEAIEDKSQEVLDDVVKIIKKRLPHLDEVTLAALRKSIFVLDLLLSPSSIAEDPIYVFSFYDSYSYESRRLAVTRILADHDPNMFRLWLQNDVHRAHRILIFLSY